MAVNPIKYLSKDLIDKPIPLDVWLQGTIEQVVGNNILIISDNFGKVKITKLESADGVVDTKSLCKGTYCCIIGVAVNTKGLPEVQATKFIDLSMQPQMKMTWETEVQEAQLLLQGKILPTIK
ncbi:uncharacterized protein LOC106711178 [Papilio machaon]|uniref:uncharacterized protein LOC106711178 n=1 Tax=Papilio machaon TaxID=76193 RepID=UPI001E66475D|nr:uncharacterized protein LOC106711178 [Papilio machaon]